VDGEGVLSWQDGSAFTCQHLMGVAVSQGVYVQGGDQETPENAVPAPAPLLSTMSVPLFDRGLWPASTYEGPPLVQLPNGVVGYFQRRQQAPRKHSSRSSSAEKGRSRSRSRSASPSKTGGSLKSSSAEPVMQPYMHGSHKYSSAAPVMQPRLHQTLAPQPLSSGTQQRAPIYPLSMHQTYQPGSGLSAGSAYLAMPPWAASNPPVQRYHHHRHHTHTPPASSTVAAAAPAQQTTAPAQPTNGRQPNTGQPPSNPPSNGQPQSARVKVHVHRHRHHLADGSVVEETVTKLPTDKSATREQYHQRSPPPQPSLEFTEPSSVIDRSNSPPVQWPDAGFCDAPGHRMDDTILAGSSRDRDAELFARMDGQHPVSNPFQAFQFQEESGMQCAECEVILDMDFLEIIGQQDVFKESLISDLAHACGNAQHQIEVTALRAGSVIANVNVKSVSPDGCSPLESVRALQEQIGQPDSLLMQGKYSCKIVSMTIKGEAAGPRRRDNSAPIMQRSLGIPCYEDNDLGYPRIFVGELMSSVPNAQAGRIRPGDLLAVVHGELAMLLLAISACKS
jgi:hypothetical protein